MAVFAFKSSPSQPWLEGKAWQPCLVSPLSTKKEKHPEKMLEEMACGVKLVKILTTRVKYVG